MSNSEETHEHADGIVEAGQKAPRYFYLLYFGLIAWGVIFMAYYLFSGWSSDAEFAEQMASHSSTYQQASTTVVATATTATAGSIDAAALFANNCAGCHGEDGAGGFGSALNGAVYKYGKTQDAVRTSIANGRGGMMPGFDGQLSAAEIDALTNFSLNLK